MSKDKVSQVEYFIWNEDCILKNTYLASLNFKYYDLITYPEKNGILGL